MSFRLLMIRLMKKLLPNSNIIYPNGCLTENLPLDYGAMVCIIISWDESFGWCAAKYWY
jgi:hypothetical protein